MKASELILKLDYIIAKEGDLCVVAFDLDRCIEPVTEVELATSSYNGRVILINA